MAIADSDPRVFFAAERTLLAWLRTGLTLIALGFVVSRFGLFLRLLSLQAPQVSVTEHPGISAAFGVAFVLAGALSILASVVQHQRFISTLGQADLPAKYSRQFALWMSLVVSLLGVALAAYLAVASR